MGKDLNNSFIKEDAEMVNKYMTKLLDISSYLANANEKRCGGTATYLLNGCSQMLLRIIEHLVFSYIAIKEYETVQSVWRTVLSISYKIKHVLTV